MHKHKTRVGMDEHETAWNEFLREVDGHRQALGYDNDWGGSYECYYRGQTSSRFALSPSLFRDSAKLALPKAKRDDYFWQVEYDLFFEFQARARELHRNGTSDWDTLFAMQHYGVPTRLLDWSETFANALFFALDHYDAAVDPVPCVWILNPYRLNELSWNSSDLVDPKNLGYDRAKKKYWTYEDLLMHDGWMGWDHPIAVYPELRNDRIQAQRGSFTIHGDLYEPFDLQFGSKRGKVLRQACIPSEAIPGAKRFLRQAGIDRHVLFPDLEGLAGALKRKYGLDERRAAK